MSSTACGLASQAGRSAAFFFSMPARCSSTHCRGIAGASPQEQSVSSDASAMSLAPTGRSANRSPEMLRRGATRA
jgi:hypothetical protein